MSGSVELTGTWLDKGKLPGLFFLLLLLLLVPPPPLIVLPPDILRFRRLFGACLDGSAKEGNVWSDRYRGYACYAIKIGTPIYAAMLDGNKET